MDKVQCMNKKCNTGFQLFFDVDALMLCGELVRNMVLYWV